MLREPLEAGGIGQRVGGVLRAVHGPVEPGAVGEVGLVGQRCAGGDERGQCLAELGEVSALRRMRVPERSRQSGEAFGADELLEGGKGRRERALGRRACVGAIGRESARRRHGIAQPARQHARGGIAPQRAHEDLLAQRFI